MTILEGAGRIIQYATSDVIHECNDNTYIIEMPVIICDNKKDAEYIQSEIGSLVGELSRNLIFDQD